MAEYKFSQIWNNVLNLVPHGWHFPCCTKLPSMRKNLSVNFQIEFGNSPSELTSPNMGNFPPHCLSIYSYEDALTSRLVCRPSWWSTGIWNRRCHTWGWSVVARMCCMAKAKWSWWNPWTAKYSVLRGTRRQWKIKSGVPQGTTYEWGPPQAPGEHVDSKSECSSAVNTVSADGRLAGSINFYCFLVACVLTVVWLAAFIFLCFFQTKSLKQNTKVQLHHSTLEHVTLSAQH